MYSYIEERYIDTNEDNFQISIYSKKVESIYLNSNYLLFSLIGPIDEVKITLLNISKEELNDYYKIDYTFESPNLSGRLQDLKIKIKTSDKIIILNLGNYYFSNSIYKTIEFDKKYNSLNNLISINKYVTKSFKASTIEVNGINRNFSISKDDLNNYKLSIDTQSGYFIRKILVNIDGAFFNVECDNFNGSFMQEALYDNA